MTWLISRDAVCSLDSTFTLTYLSDTPRSILVSQLSDQFPLTISRNAILEEFPLLARALQVVPMEIFIEILFKLLGNLLLGLITIEILYDFRRNLLLELTSRHT